MKLSRNKLQRIAENVIARLVNEGVVTLTESVLNEISPEKRAAAFVKANNYRAPEDKTVKKGNRVVDTEYEKERKQRQKDLFGNSVARDIGKELGVDRGQRNAKWIEDYKKDIEYYKGIINDPKSTEATRLGAKEHIKDLQKSLRMLKDNTLGFHLEGNDDGYHLSYNGNVAYSNTDRRNFSYSNPREANRAYQMQDVTDRLMGLDDEMNQGRKLNGRVDYLKRRQKNVANTEKYYADKEDWENRKSDADAEMRSYKSKNPISRMFSKKPQPFNEPEPQKPEWDKGGGGVYFTDKSSDYDKRIKDQENLNDIYRTANKKGTAK